MDLRDLVKRTRGGVLNICAVRPDTNQIIATGSGFYCCSHLLTNHHVMNVPPGCDIWIRRGGDSNPAKEELRMKHSEWLSRIVTTSDEHSYDYAVMKCPELASWNEIYDFPLLDPTGLPIGTSVAFMGYPLEHSNLTCHSGVVSSFYSKKSAHIVQVDGSVNAGNSGGPLIDIDTGAVIGIVSRKATGLSRAFDEFRKTLSGSKATMQGRGGIFMGGVDYFGSLADNFDSLLKMTHEIERQANVGIGYAFSAKHLLDEDVLRNHVRSI